MIKPTSPALTGLRRNLLHEIDTSPNYYVEIGANDGVAQTNTLALETFFGWRGLLIEPINSVYEKLAKNRSRRRNTLLRAACVSSRFPDATVELVYSNLMSVAIGLDSDVSDPFAHADSGRYQLRAEDPVRVESAPAMTMTRALELAGAPDRIGLLSLDVEGAELEVLKGIDFDKYRFDWMLIECRDLGRLETFLRNHGYVLQKDLSTHDDPYGDYLFARQ